MIAFCSSRGKFSSDDNEIPISLLPVSSITISCQHVSSSSSSFLLGFSQSRCPGCCEREKIIGDFIGSLSDRPSLSLEN